MSSDIHSTTRANLRHWHRPRCAHSSSSSPDPSRPVTPIDPAFPHLPPSAYQKPPIPLRTFSAEEYHNLKSVPDPHIVSGSQSSEDSLDEETLYNDEHDEIRHPARLRTQTVTPATVLRARQHESDQMRIPFPGSTHRHSSSSTDSPPSYSDSDPPSACEELGGIPARHPLRNRANAKGSRFLLGDADARPSSPPKTRPMRMHTLLPESTFNQPPGSPPHTSSLRLKPKKIPSHRGAITLLKSLGSSHPERPEELEAVEFDWAQQRHHDFETRAMLLEQQYEQERISMGADQAQPQVAADGGQVQEKPDARPSGWERTPEGRALQLERDEEDARRFTFKDCLFANQSYVTPHPKDAVPYPLAYDKVDLQTDRHSHDLVRHLFFGRPSIYDLAQRPLGTVLDLGCGDGAWICDAAHAWRNTRFFGLDVQNLHPSRAQLVADLGETADNIKFTYFNFLIDKLPYLDDRFDLVRMANLKWAIPEDKWDFVLGEVHRVLRSDGWVEIIDDDFLLGSSPSGTLSAEQRAACDILEKQFTDMLEARNLPLNTGSQFMNEKLGPWFGSAGRQDFPISISQARPLSVELRGQAPIQAMLPPEGVSQKAAKLMGFSNDKHLSVSSASSSARSRSGSGSSTASLASSYTSYSTRDEVGMDDADHQCEGELTGSVKELSRPPIYQPSGLDVYPGRFMPFAPAQLSAHAVRNMQSVLAAKEAIRAHVLKKPSELERLGAKAKLLAEERQRFEEMSWEWREHQKTFDDTFWEFESAMLQRLGLPQRCFDPADDDEDPSRPMSGLPRPQTLRSSSGLSMFHRNSDVSMLSPTPSTFAFGSNVTVRLIRVYTGWKQTNSFSSLEHL